MSLPRGPDEIRDSGLGESPNPGLHPGYECQLVARMKSGGWPSPAPNPGLHPGYECGSHAIASISALDVDTAPNTPPCIVTIFSAARWLPRSVAPVQSDKMRHSKPRSLA